MEKEALKTLEFSRITELLQQESGSVLGKEMARAVLPSSDFEEVQERMHQTAEAVRVYQTAAPPLGGIRDIRQLIKKVKLGAVLDAAEITDVMNTMQKALGSAQAKNFDGSAAVKGDTVDEVEDDKKTDKNKKADDKKAEQDSKKQAADKQSGDKQQSQPAVPAPTAPEPGGGVSKGKN